MKFGRLRELLSFTRKERTGIIGLLFIIFILIIAGKLIPFFISPDNTDFSKWELEVNNYLSKKGRLNPCVSAVHPVAFNPNDVDAAGLENMGLPPRVIANWMKYLEKGGRFRDKEGVKKIFGMTPALFDQLDSFIVIVPVKTAEVRPGNIRRMNQSDRGFKRDTISRQTYSKKERVMVQDLNRADSIHLLGIPGIGPVFASRIIRYRNLLGGYYDVSQLREVYGMREENFCLVSAYFTADQSTLKTFNINFATLQELGHHPYIGYRTARKIFKLRDKMGKFTSPDDLSSAIAADSLKRLIPYMKFNQ